MSFGGGNFVNCGAVGGGCFFVCTIGIGLAAALGGLAFAASFLPAAFLAAAFLAAAFLATGFAPLSFFFGMVFLLAGIVGSSPKLCSLHRLGNRGF
ncbi:MAG: hypothetical protein EXS17_01960 [Phycisphaerales bacterium]|nr:hypothetical protein [Phycisphaerales bacterium]